MKYLLCVMALIFCITMSTNKSFASDAEIVIKLQKIELLEKKMLAKQMQLLANAASNEEKERISLDTKAKQGKIIELRNRVMLSEQK